MEVAQFRGGGGTYSHDVDVIFGGYIQGHLKVNFGVLNRNSYFWLRI